MVCFVPSGMTNGDLIKSFSSERKWFTSCQSLPTYSGL